MGNKSFLRRLFCFFAGSLLLFSGCAQPASMERRELFAMDTVMTLTAYGPGTGPALDAAAAELDRLDAALSCAKADSALSQLNAAGGGDLSPDLQALLPRALEISQITDGAFDMSLLPLSEAWGFYGDTPALPSPSVRRAAMALCGYEKLQLEEGRLSFAQPGMGIDLGGIGKGYAAERLLELLKEQGVSSAILSLGGNVQTLGLKPDGSLWRVAVQDPFDPEGYAGILSCGETAVVTSGDYQRYFEQDGRRYHHILDRETGFPAESGLASVTVVSQDPVLADGLSTALFVMGLEEACAFWRANSEDFQAVLITQAGEIFVTAGLEDTFTSQKSFQVVTV